MAADLLSSIALRLLMVLTERGAIARRPYRTSLGSLAVGMGLKEGDVDSVAAAIEELSQKWVRYEDDGIAFAGSYICEYTIADDDRTVIVLGVPSEILAVA